MDTISLLIFCAPLLMCVAEQQEYFLHHNVSTWDRARIHCQVCYKELVTLTPNNIQSIVQNLTSDYWIGLRKNPNITAFNSTMPWSHWANKAPLTFQNWYPGWPRAKPKKPPLAPVLNMSGVCPVCECCCYSGCLDVSTTTVTVTTSNITITYESNLTVTDMPTMTTMTTPMGTTWLLTGVTDGSTATVTDEDDEDDDDDDGYIEDSCVAMLSFGAWIEKHCWEDLPYICYEEGFTSVATLTNLNSTNATVSWQAGPGDISHYRLEVRSLRGDWTSLTRNLTDLTYDLDKLIEGSGYLVQVFPVKCDRDLPSKKVIFYTKPGAAENLTVTKEAEKSIFLSWDPPVGNSDHYFIEVRDHPGHRWKTNATNQEVNNLLPGGFYTIDVTTGAGDFTHGDSVSISAYTKPGKVSALRVTENKKRSLLLHWNRPEGATTGYRVEAWRNETMYFIFFNETLNETHYQSVTVDNLPMGTKVRLSVVALGIGTLEGESVDLEELTTPGPIKNLSLSTTSVNISATWDRPNGGYEGFTVWLQLGDATGDQENTTNTYITFQSQKSAANYTLSVTAFNGHLKSSTVSGSMFTKPVMPTDARVTHYNKSHITLEWTEPKNTVSVKYQVKYNASFWDHSLIKEFDNQTSYTFDGLHPGTKYNFEVRTMAGDLLSNPTTVSPCTAPEKRKITLSMVCSSQIALSCDNSTTRAEVFNKLEEHFKELLKDEVFWELKWKQNAVATSTKH